MSEFGYAGEILRVDLTARKIEKLPTARYAGRFLGGRGIAAAIHWEETPPAARAFDPENRLVFITGPLMGFLGLAGCRWEICGTSPGLDADFFSYANFGGSWGAWLKYAGYDGLVVTGRAGGPVYLLIESDRVEIRDAATLWGKTTTETQDILQAGLGKGARVLVIGPAGENLVPFATVYAEDSASGSGGMGSVMGSKNLKAVVVRAEAKMRPVPANPDRLKSLSAQVRGFQPGNWEDHARATLKMAGRGMCRAENGRQFKFFCQATSVYTGPAVKYYGQGTDVDRLGTRLCDIYGLDTAVMQPLIMWLGRCYQEGILGDEAAGLPLSRMGSAEFIEALVQKLARREGFGDVLAAGTLKAAAYLGRGAEKLIGSSIANRNGETRDHDPRLMLTNALLMAMEPRRSVYLLHAMALPLTRWLNWLKGLEGSFLTTEVLRGIAERLWGSPDALDFTSYAGKALASKKVQDYAFTKESLILCDFAWPIYQVHSLDNIIGPYTLESRLVSAITGREIDEAELEKTGERIFNLQRAILTRQGWGGRGGDVIMDFHHREPLQAVFFDVDCIVPGKDGALASRQGMVVEKAAFEQLKDEYYARRGWDVASGLQTEKKLEELGLGDMVGDLRGRGLLMQGPPVQLEETTGRIN